MPILTLSPISLLPISPGSWPSRASHKGLPTKVQPIERPIDPQRLGEPSWASRKIAQALGSAIVCHDRDPFERLERPDQDAGADPRRLARDIQHPGNAVGEIDIGVATLEKERTIARRHAPIGVPGGVADDIGLGFDDATAGDAFGQFPHQQLANEKARERGRIDRELRARERRVGRLGVAGFQAIRSTRCAREGPGSNGSPKYWVSRMTLPSRNSMMLTV